MNLGSASKGIDRLSLQIHYARNRPKPPRGGGPAAGIAAGAFEYYRQLDSRREYPAARELGGTWLDCG